MNISQLEYYSVLYRTGSFSEAAEHLNITQPALSIQIQKLEESLDFKLLDRARRPFKFTDEGHYFYEKTVEVLQQLEQLKTITLELGESVKGNLKVGMIPTIAPYLVPLFIEQLNADYPDLQIEVVETKTEDVITGIKLGNLDCGIISTPVSAPLNFAPLFYERFYAYVSENHPLFDQDTLDTQKIPEEEVWYLDEGNCFQNQINSICSINQQKKSKQNFVFHSNSIESLRRIVENKNGITFIPELATINIPPEQEELIKDLSGNQPIREISLITAKGFAKERQVDALQKVIQKSIPQRMLKKPSNWIVDTML